MQFDIAAKGETTATQDQTSPMLQNLLADRFQLRVHRETKELPIYALLVTKNGPKLKPSREGDCFDLMCGTFNLLSGRIVGEKVTMSQFAAALARFPFNQTVVDKTGLAGTCDITLQWTPDLTPDADSAGPSIFTARQEQLGLKLESQKGPVEILVVDHVVKPSENSSELSAGRQ